MDNLYFYDTNTFWSDWHLKYFDCCDCCYCNVPVSTANSAIVSAVLVSLSNVAKLTQTSSGTITLSENVGPTNFVLTADSAQNITFNDDYSQATTVTILGDTDSTDTVTNNSNIDLTVVAYSSDFVEANTTITGSATSTDSIVMYAIGDGDWDTDSAAPITGVDHWTIN